MHSSSNKHNARSSSSRAASNTINKPTTTTTTLSSPSITSSPSVSCAATIDEEDDHQVTTTTTCSGRAVAALPLHTPTTYQTIVSTLSALGPIASTSGRTVGSWGRSAFGQLSSNARRVVSEGSSSTSSNASHSKSLSSPLANDATTGHVPLPVNADLHQQQQQQLPGIDEQEEDDNNRDEADQLLSASIHHRPSIHDDPILFSSWDTLPYASGSSGNGNSGARRVLIQVFHSGRLKIWDASELSTELNEVLNIDFGKAVGNASAYPLSARFVPVSPESETALHKLIEGEKYAPLLAILASDNVIHLYSTSSHRIVKRLSLATSDASGRMVNFQVNERFLVAATVQPLSLYAWNLATLELCPFSPIMDVAPHPYDFTPVYSLSSSRLLAYSSVTSPNYGGSGVIASSGWNDENASATTAGYNATSTSAGYTGSRGGAGAHNGSAGNGPDYGETARRWGEGMMSHMKAVTDYGYSRYYGNGNHGSPGITPPYHRTGTSGNTANTFSKSAPHPSSPFYSRSPSDAAAAERMSSPPASKAPMYSPRMASATGAFSSQSSPSPSSVVVLDLVASMKSFHVSSSSRPNSSLSSGPQRARSPQVITRSSTPNTGRDYHSQNGLIRIAHFKPSRSHPLTLLSINPNGTLILTSSSEGHSFHIFELRPPSCAGNSPIRTSSPSRGAPAHHRGSSRGGKALQASNADLKVWHRYRLNRGLTVAKTVSAQWSPDSRFVLVSTSRGTVHVYPINPLGGRATPETHLSSIVKNEKTLARLSVTVNALARIKAPKLPSPPSMTDGTPGKDENKEINATATTTTSPPDMLFVSATESLPVHGPSTSRPANRSGNRAIPLLLFYPHLHSVLQSSLHLSSSPKTAPSDAPLSSRVTSQAVSGLTQMMRNRGSALPTFESETLLARQEWISQWPLALQGGPVGEEEDIRVDLSNLGERKENVGSLVRTRNTSAHEAEIESFSHAPAVLPRSIYLAQILTFHTYPPATPSKQANLLQQFSSGNFSLPRTTKVTVREEVSHRFGSYGDQPFDESTELHSAMHTILDASNLASSYGGGNGAAGEQAGGFSPSSNSPAFPNGYGKTSSSSKWLPSPSLASLPIPIGIGISPQTVRQAATKVRKYSASMRSPRLSAVGSGGGGHATGGAAGGGHSLQGSTLSFEDDDAVLAQIPPEMLEVDEEGVDLGRRPRQEHRAPGGPSSASLRPDTYGSPSPAPLPSLSVGTASSADSQAAKSTDSPEDVHPRADVRSMEDSTTSPAMHAASIVDEEGRNEGEWDSFELEGIDDEEDLKGPPVLPVKHKLPSPLLSHAMLPILAAKSDHAGSQRNNIATREMLSTPSSSSDEQKSILTVPGAFNSTAVATPSVGTALDMAYKPLEPEGAAAKQSDTFLEAPLVSPALNTTAPYQETATAPSPLSSSPAVSSAAEFSASPATAAVLAMKRNNKKKNKKGKN
ncbi:hypothetical protein P389DRAFT_167241 [Cystobasidium minutum MCA 4210]|uniref:uncharacterized protein n=1 Tax=Cystobasidium minutum MCA 4210 TaxID=1397322 RepID=UPI0034CE1883|eukprot:jgi/Rhomi1/167241/fgenesh1_kg.2_\